MKVAIAQLNYTIGDFDAGKAKIIAAIAEARRRGADLAVFAEHAVEGTPAYDLLGKVTFLERCEEALAEIASHCRGIAAVVGLPVQSGTTTVSAAAVIENGEVVRLVGKRTIQSIDEKSYLSPGKGCECVQICGRMVAVAVGEDVDGYATLGRQVELIVNPTADPYSRGVVERRYSRYGKTAYEAGCPVVYVNQVGAQTDVVYDGSSAAFDARGRAVCLSASFAEDICVVDVDADNAPIDIPEQNKTANVFKAIKLGLADYFEKNNFGKACIGLSGGIDSAVAAAMAVEALGSERVRVMMMPSQFSKDRSVDDAVQLARNLGVEHDVIPIREVYKSIIETMMPILGGTPFGLAEENIQARIRCVMLMAMSNKFGHVVLNTSNKSELAMGYGAMYGDDIGSISILGDLYKSEIYDLARYINRNAEIIPESILLKIPSAETGPESMPPYEVWDSVLYRMIEEGQHREEIIDAGFDAETVHMIHRKLVRSQYKRFQFCPTLRLSTRPLQQGVMMPFTSKYGFGY